MANGIKFNSVNYGALPAGADDSAGYNKVKLSHSYDPETKTFSIDYSEQQASPDIQTKFDNNNGMLEVIGIGTNDQGQTVITTGEELGGHIAERNFLMPGTVEKVVINNSRNGESIGKESLSVDEFLKKYNDGKNAPEFDNLRIIKLEQAEELLTDGIKNDERSALEFIADHYGIARSEITGEPPVIFTEGWHSEKGNVKYDPPIIDDPMLNASDFARTPSHVPDKESDALVDGLRDRASKDDIATRLKAAVEALEPNPGADKPDSLTNNEPKPPSEGLNPDHKPNTGKGIGE